MITCSWSSVLLKDVYHFDCSWSSVAFNCKMLAGVTGTTGEASSSVGWFPAGDSSKSNTSEASVTPTLLPSNRQQQHDRLSPCPTPSRLTPNQKSPSPISDSLVTSTCSATSSGRRTRSPFFDHFRRRSKSDSKSSSSADFTSHSKLLAHRRGSSIMSVIQKHIPWSDKRSCSVDVPSSQSSSNTAFSRGDGHRLQMINPVITSHLSSRHHLDPYYTYTYGQDPRLIHGKRNRTGSGSTVTRVMDIFKRQDSYHGSNQNISNTSQSSNKRSFDFGDLGKQSQSLFNPLFPRDINAMLFCWILGLWRCNLVVCLNSLAHILLLQCVCRHDVLLDWQRDRGNRLMSSSYNWVNLSCDTRDRLSNDWWEKKRERGTGKSICEEEFHLLCCVVLCCWSSWRMIISDGISCQVSPVLCSVV